MTDFSVGDAGVAGFRLIGRKPLTMLAWGLFIAVALLLPAALIIGLVAPSFTDLIDAARSGDIDEDQIRSIMPMQAGFAVFLPLIGLLSIVGRAMMIGAVFRAVLEPKRSAFAYLRLGGQELWIALVLMVEGVFFGFVICLAAVAVGIPAALLFSHHEIVAGVCVAVFGVLASLGLIIWLALRFSMALPLSFVERRFAFFESWNFTRGHAGSLLLLCLLVFALLILANLVVRVIAGIAFLSFGATAMMHHGALHETLHNFFHQPTGVWMQQLAPVAIGIGLLVALMTSVMMVIGVAPWAAAYKAIAKDVTPEPGVAGLTLGA